MFRTKDELARILKNQLRTHSLDKITVKSIVEECGVNRQTFYYHFEDMNDLFKWTFGEDLRKTISENRQYNNWQAGCLATMDYLRENRDIVYNVINSIDRRTLELSLQQGADWIMTRVVNELAKEMNVSEDDKQFIVVFYRVIFIGLITDWVERGMKENPQEMIDKLTNVTQGNIKQALERFEKHI